MNRNEKVYRNNPLSNFMLTPESGEIGPNSQENVLEGNVEGAEVPEMSAEQKKIAEKQKEIEKLRAAEKFIKKLTGEFECSQCGYIYKPDEGTKDVPPGTSFADLPRDFKCPGCRAPKSFFDPLTVTIAGFEDNQGYGLGTNSMTGDQKNTLIFGGLAVFFILFLCGYLLE